MKRYQRQHQHQHQQHQQNFCQVQKCSILFLFAVLSLIVSSVQGDDYLKEAPSFLKSCKLSDASNGECISRAIENIFTNWKDGVPGLKDLGSIDPFNVKRIHLEQNNPNVNMKMDIKDMITTGLSQTSILKSSVQGEYTLKFLLKLPKLYMKGNYRIKGTILLLNLNSSGQFQSDISGAEVVLSFKANLIKIKDQKFFNITNVQSNVKNVDNFHIRFENLFNGNAELEDSANDVFNQNWRSLFEIMRPVIEETLDVISLDRFNKIFRFVPATYFFVDLP